MDCFWTIWAASFRVHGHVQNVGVPEHTQQEALRLGVRGYCMSMRNKTIVGEMQGTLPEYNRMKTWLRHVGSPDALIDRAYFFDERLIAAYTYPDFSIRYEEDEKTDEDGEQLTNN